MGNAIKKGDIPEVLSQLSSIIDAAEDRFEDIGDLFDEHAGKTQKAMMKEIREERRDSIRSAKRQMADLQGKWGESLGL